MNKKTIGQKKKIRVQKTRRKGSLENCIRCIVRGRDLYVLFIVFNPFVKTNNPGEVCKRHHVPGNIMLGVLLLRYDTVVACIFSTAISNKDAFVCTTFFFVGGGFCCCCCCCLGNDYLVVRYILLCSAFYSSYCGTVRTCRSRLKVLAPRSSRIVRVQVSRVGSPFGGLCATLASEGHWGQRPPIISFLKTGIG